MMKEVAEKTLQQEHYGDCISKQKVLYILKENWNMISDADDAMQESINTIEALTPVPPQTKQELYNDAISRKMVIQHICEGKSCYEKNCKGVLFNRCMDITWVNELPSVSSSEKPGKSGQWIEHFDESGKWYECDQCHTDWGGAVNFCPNCGTKMIEDTGSEE